MFRKLRLLLLTSSLLVTVSTLGSAMLVSAQEETVITFWNGFTGPDRPAVEALVEQFNDTHEGMRVEMTITPWDSLMQTLLSSMSAGEGPTIAGVHFNFVPQYAEAGLIMDLTDQMAEGSDLDPANFPEALNELLQYEDRFYAAPVNYATLLMYYNRDLFEAAGLDPDTPPATWDEWIEAIRTLTDDDTYGLVLGERQTIPNWPILLWGNGGDVVVNGESGLASPEVIEALELWGGLVRDEGISPIGLTGAEADQLFQSGRAAMAITGPWMVNGFTDAGVNFDVAPIPAGPAGEVTLGDSVVFMVNEGASDAEKEAALAFISFWNSRESQLLWSQQTGFPPVRLDLADAPELFEANEWASKFAAVVPVSRFFLGNQEAYTQIENDIFVPMIQSITQGIASADEAARFADEQLRALLTAE